MTGDKPVIAYCRIGERSSHTWFVLHELLGYENVRNYDGSWTEYGSLVGGLERAVLLDRLRPRDRLRAGDVAGALRALLLVAGHGDDLARELLRRAHVDQDVAVAERLADLVAARAD